MRWGWALSFFLLACTPGARELPRAEAVGTLGESEVVPPYNRDDWGRWVDADRDCQNTRAEVLIAESATPVTFTDERACVVATGSWTCPYTGVTTTLASAFDVDHVVALEEAHYAGGWRWTREQKITYANDLSNPHHLVAASQTGNRSKGARGPTEWMPPNPDYQCVYLKRRYDILLKYGLQVDCGLYVELLGRYCR